MKKTFAALLAALLILTVLFSFSACVKIVKQGPSGNEGKTTSPQSEKNNDDKAKSDLTLESLMKYLETGSKDTFNPRKLTAEEQAELRADVEKEGGTVAFGEDGSITVTGKGQTRFTIRTDGTFEGVDEDGREFSNEKPPVDDDPNNASGNDDQSDYNTPSDETPSDETPSDETPSDDTPTENSDESSEDPTSGEELTWPTEGPLSRLPAPGFGTIIGFEDGGFDEYGAELTDCTPEDYRNYVAALKNAGFNVDESTEDDDDYVYYTAYDAEDYGAYVEYSDGDMYIAVTGEPVNRPKPIDAWPTTGALSGLPEPDFGEGYLYVTEENAEGVYVTGGKPENFSGYVEKVKALGFDDVAAEANEDDFCYFLAYNEEGYAVLVSVDEGEFLIAASTEPIKDDLPGVETEWPDEGTLALLPDPGIESGYVFYELLSMDVAYVEDGTEEQFDAYVSKLQENGYNLDVETDEDETGKAYTAYNDANVCATVMITEEGLYIFAELGEDVDDPTHEWPTEGGLSRLPVPDFGDNLDVDEHDGIQYAEMTGVTEEDFEAYVEKVKAAGFTIDVDEGTEEISGIRYYEAFDSEHRAVHVSYSIEEFQVAATNDPFFYDE